MPFNVNANQGTPRLKGRPGTGPVAMPGPQAAPAAKAPAGPTARADAAIARNLGTGNLPSLDGLIDKALTAAKTAPLALGVAARAAAVAPAVAAAVRASDHPRPLRPDQRVASAISRGVSRGWGFLKSLGSLAKGAVTKAVNAVKTAIADPKKVLQNVKDGVVHVAVSIWHKVAEQIGLSPLPRTVTDDPKSANEPDDATTAEATKNLADPGRKLAATTAVGKLSPAQREAYGTLMTSLAAEPRAQAALQELAIAGKLGGGDLAGGKALIDHLKALSTQEVAPGIDRATLLSQVVQEAANPVRISQESRNTCGATTAQILLANRAPAEYVRLVGQLASPAGQVTLRDGTQLQRDPNWSSDVDGGRTLSSRLIQPAFMDGAGMTDYDNVKDGNAVPLTKWAIPGMMPWGLSKLLTKVTGQDYDFHLSIADGPLTDALRTPKWKGGTPEHPVPVAVNYADSYGEVGPHYLQVTGYDAAKKTLSLINPWGRRETIPEADFRSHLIAEIYEH